MKLTRSGEYGINGLLYLARSPEGTVAYVREVSEALNISESFLAKIFQAFVRSGILASQRGIRGGYSLTRPPSNITLRETIEAVQGPIALNKCLLREERPCGRHRRCGLRKALQEVQGKVEDYFESTTIGSLAESTQFSGVERI